MLTDDWISLSAEPLDAAAVIRFVTDARAGAANVFVGTTRAEVNPAGRSLIALDYEAYPEMAVAQLADLARRCRQRTDIVKLAILHRTGRVALAEPSVIVAVSTRHRAESFDACRWIINALKAEVAIWKKEVWEDGDETWVHP